VPVDPLDWQISQDTASNIVARLDNTVGAAESVLSVAATGHDKMLFLKAISIRRGENPLDVVSYTVAVKGLVRGRRMDEASSRRAERSRESEIQIQEEGPSTTHREQTGANRVPIFGRLSGERRPLASELTDPRAIATRIEIGWIRGAMKGGRRLQLL
ncbi:unnamed protein product, partial [Brassica oleracea]